MTPRALDLFCKAGGATKGLQRAGFHVTGIDIEPQPRYCGDAFIQADALRPPVDLAAFDFIWASPVCKAFTSAGGYQREYLGKEYPNQIPATRAMLENSGALYAIENVPQAPLRRDLVLTGPMFPGLRVLRKRVFEMNFLVLRPGHRSSKSWLREGFVSVCGNGTPSWVLKAGLPRASTDNWRDAMGIDWMNRAELAQAIPPAYAEFIGRAAMREIEHRRRAA